MTFREGDPVYYQNVLYTYRRTTNDGKIVLNPSDPSLACVYCEPSELATAYDPYYEQNLLAERQRLRDADPLLFFPGEQVFYENAPYTVVSKRYSDGKYTLQSNDFSHTIRSVYAGSIKTHYDLNYEQNLLAERQRLRDADPLLFFPGEQVFYENVPYTVMSERYSDGKYTLQSNDFSHTFKYVYPGFIKTQYSHELAVIQRERQEQINNLRTQLEEAQRQVSSFDAFINFNPIVLQSVENRKEYNNAKAQVQDLSMQLEKLVRPLFGS